MDHTYTTMMSGIPTALAIWLALIGVSAVAFALLAAIAGRARRRTDGSTTGRAAEPVAGYIPRNAATLRALAAAKAVTTEKPAPGATRRPGAGQPEPSRPERGGPTPSGPRFTRPKPGRPERDAPEPRAPEADAVEAPVSDQQRYADELATAATRAGATADKRTAEWERAQRAAESAWQAYEEAEGAARRALRAAAFPTPETPLTPAEYADRERYLHRAAQSAHARGELSTDQLIDALSHRNGFDPRLHPFEQDALLRRLGRDRLLRAYQAAAERERTAWREAEQAKAARRSLDREAAVAALNVVSGPEPASASRHIRVTTPVLSLR